MVVGVLHLSDIHFPGKNGYQKENIEMIGRVVCGSTADVLIIIVSGDIAYSGKKEEYQVAKNFFDDLEKYIKEKQTNIKIEYAMVPGNHDMDYAIVDCNLEEEALQQKRNENCIHFLNCYDLFVGNNEYSYKPIHLNGKNIGIHLINTALYSSLEEDKGCHLISDNSFEDFVDKAGENDIDIAVMHHSHHWYNWECKKKLEDVLYRRTNIVVVGHEHYTENAKIGYENNETYYYLGGELANKGCWDNSSFYYSMLDMGSMALKTQQYTLNASEKIYIKNGNEKINKLKKVVNSPWGISPNLNFITEFLKDTKYQIAESLLDYFIFPSIEEKSDDEKKSNREFANAESFICEIQDRKHVEICGFKDSGKTLLAKYLFDHYKNNKIVLYIDMDDVYFTCSAGIKRAFTNIYSNDEVQWERFLQADKSEKVIIIDNVDYTDKQNEEFWKSIERDFDIIIRMVKSGFDFDIENKVEEKLMGVDCYSYSILPFYKNKRRDLVYGVVNVLQSNKNNIDEMIDEICDSLDGQKSVFRTNPDFIVQYTKYYFNNSGDATVKDGNIFSKVFEANIVSLIAPYCKNMTVDKVMILTDKIAYLMHTTKTSPIEQDKILDAVREYNDMFDSDVNYVKLIEILTLANILVEKDNKYSFTERNYLAYFVAREIKRKCIEDRDYKELDYILKYSCYGINADILLFVMYITDNVTVVRMILDKAERWVQNWNQFSISPVNVEYISMDYTTDGVKFEERKNEKNKMEIKEVNQERKQDENERSLENNSRLIYSYEENLDLKSEIIRACSLMTIISRIMPNFEHMMLKEDKEKCVDLVYRMPLKIFYEWANDVDRRKKVIVDDILNCIKNVYSHQLDDKVNENTIMDLLKKQSILLLMDLMNTSISEASRKNTNRYLDKYSYSENDLYEIEHLMSLDKRDSCDDFIDYAITCFNSANIFKKEIIRMVAKHFIVTSKKMKRNQFDKLNAKLWQGGIKGAQQATLLTDKKKYQNRE